MEFEEIPNIPQYKQRIEDIGKFKRKDLRPAHNLKAVFKAVRNYLAANAVGAARDEALAQQLINIIFCKIYDEKFTKPDDIASFRAGAGEKPKNIQRNVVKMAVDILDPNEDDLIIDPACGSGGFLIEALRHVWKKADRKGREYGWPRDEINRQKQKLAAENFRGIDKDYFLSKAAKAYMTLIGGGTAGIVCDDSLDALSWKRITSQKIQLGKFDILLANPPFGAKIPVCGAEKMKQFETGYKWKFNEEAGERLNFAEHPLI